MSNGGWTFRKLIEAGMAVNAHCDARGIHKRVDLPALATRLGDHHRAMADDLQRVLICPRCRSKRTSFTYFYDSGKPELIDGAWGGR
jgi:hypothetical protein